MNITLYYGEFDNEKEFNIKLDENERYIKCFDRPLDVTMIEIIEKDDIIKDNFLLPDLNYKNGLELYDNKSFYLAGYPKNSKNEFERSSSSGKITDIICESEFEHSLNTHPGNSNKLWNFFRIYFR